MRQHACDPSHARHSINNSIIVLDWITFWAKKNKKKWRRGKRVECVTPAAKRSERLSLRAMARAFIKLFRFCIGLSIGKKIIDAEIPDFHDASLIRNLLSVKAFESFNTARSHNVLVEYGRSVFQGKFYIIAIATRFISRDFIFSFIFIIFILFILIFGVFFVIGDKSCTK